MVSHQFCGLDALSPTQLPLFVDTFRRFYLPLAIAYSISILSLLSRDVGRQHQLCRRVIPDGAPYGMSSNSCKSLPSAQPNSSYPWTLLISPSTLVTWSRLVLIRTYSLSKGVVLPNARPCDGLCCSPVRTPSPRTSFYLPPSASKGVVLLQTLSLSKGGVILSSYLCDRVWYPLTAPVPEHPAQSSMPW